MKDLVKNGFKKVDYAKAKKEVDVYRVEYKASGSSDSLNDSTY